MNAILSQCGATSVGHIAIIACQAQTTHNITIDNNTYLSYEIFRINLEFEKTNLPMLLNKILLVNIEQLPI